jgi:hypothetical protein
MTCPCGADPCTENDHLFWPEEAEAIATGTSSHDDVIGGYDSGNPSGTEEEPRALD